MNTSLFKLSAAFLLALSACGCAHWQRPLEGAPRCAGPIAADYELTRPGSFTVGCNYWASHAGTHMWRDWKPEIVEQDFKRLSGNGLKVLRVFPLWPDFQPICQVRGYAGGGKYIGFKDSPLPPTGPGSNGVSEEQLRHFEVLADLARKYNLKLIVGLVTGWMSGQLYVPPALEGKKILTDPDSLMWQQKYVTTFVHRFKSHPAIIAWDFGNECNCMGGAANYAEAYVWSSVIAGAIRSEDTSRPVVSGMHGLGVDDNARWRIADQAALTDVLTIHPYSLFTPYAAQDQINGIRAILHSAAESRLYADIGGKPCLTEEIGVLGPMTSGEREKAAFARAALFSNWAHDGRGMLWWCGFDQLGLGFSPYNYAAVEQELGLFKQDGTPKPVLAEFRNFSHFLETLPFKALPPRKTEAVCLLTEGQDNWAAAYGSFILAKQAGFDLQFQKAGQALKEAPVYLMPSVKGGIFKDSWFEVLDRVKAGATLYLSWDSAYMPTLTEPMGIEIRTNIERRGAMRFIAKFGNDRLDFETVAERKLDIDPRNSAVLAREPDGNPAFMVSSYGKGKIYLLTFPREVNLATTVGSFDKGKPAYRDLYRLVAKDAAADRVLTQDNPYVGVTEHPMADAGKVVVLINYDFNDASLGVKLKEGWGITACLYGQAPSGGRLTLKANDAAVYTVRRAAEPLPVSTYLLSGGELTNRAEQVVYKKTPQENLRLYLLRPSGRPTGPLPAIVYFTGGGWVKGTPDGMIANAAWFRDHGIIGIAADYRVKSRHGTTPLECVKDGKSAIRYIRAHARELGVDPDRIIAAGGSAGGHVAAATVLAGNDEPGEDATVSSRPNALVLHNPVLGVGFGDEFFAAHPDCSPLAGVRAGWPPTVLSCGTADRTTPYAAAEQFAEKMRLAGNVCELITVTNADHSCDWPATNVNFLPTVERMLKFLRAQGVIPVGE